MDVKIFNEILSDNSKVFFVEFCDAYTVARVKIYCESEQSANVLQKGLIDNALFASVE